jgi:hypothetical protein
MIVLPLGCRGAGWQIRKFRARSCGRVRLPIERDRFRWISACGDGANTGSGIPTGSLGSCRYLFGGDQARFWKCVRTPEGGQSGIGVDSGPPPRCRRPRPRQPIRLPRGTRTANATGRPAAGPAPRAMGEAGRQGHPDRPAGWRHCGPAGGHATTDQVDGGAFVHGPAGHKRTITLPPAARPAAGAHTPPSRHRSTAGP